MSRSSALLVLALVLTPFAIAKDKNRASLSADVLKAQTVLVVIHPEAGEPLTDPTANRSAQEAVERALQKWGRFRIVMEPQTADLVMAVRKGTGRSVSPTIGGSPADNRPVILQPGDNGDIRIGTQQGHRPDLTRPGVGAPQDNGPHARTEIGPSEDMLEVYRGGVEYPLDSPPVWRYTAKGALRSPAAPAVDQFRKVFDEAEKNAAQTQQKQKP